jgi:hypothetical protein
MRGEAPFDTHTRVDQGDRSAIVSDATNRSSRPRIDAPGREWKVGIRLDRSIESDSLQTPKEAQA